MDGWTEHAMTSLDHDADTEKYIFNHQKIINQYVHVPKFDFIVNVFCLVGFTTEGPSPRRK